MFDAIVEGLACHAVQIYSIIECNNVHLTSLQSLPELPGIDICWFWACLESSGA